MQGVLIILARYPHYVCELLSSPKFVLTFSVYIIRVKTDLRGNESFLQKQNGFTTDFVIYSLLTVSVFTACC